MILTCRTKNKAKDHTILEIFYVKELNILIGFENFQVKPQEPPCQTTWNELIDLLFL